MNLRHIQPAIKHYLQSRPKKWENDAVEMMIRLCRKHQLQNAYCTCSSCEALDTIAKCKAEGLPLTAETCAHYIYFNAEDIPDCNCLYKCAPPIREKENNELLKTSICDMVYWILSQQTIRLLRLILKRLKVGDLKKAWGGIAGLQFLLSASWTAMKEMLSLEKFIPLLTEKPAAFLKIDNRKGKIESWI